MTQHQVRRCNGLLRRNTCTYTPTQHFLAFVVLSLNYVFYFRFNVAVVAGKSLRTNVTSQCMTTTPSVTPVTILLLPSNSSS